MLARTLLSSVRSWNLAQKDHPYVYLLCSEELATAYVRNSIAVLEADNSGPLQLHQRENDHWCSQDPQSCDGIEESAHQHGSVWWAVVSAFEAPHSQMSCPWSLKRHRPEFTNCSRFLPFLEGVVYHRLVQQTNCPIEFSFWLSVEGRRRGRKFRNRLVICGS